MLLRKNYAILAIFPSILVVCTVARCVLWVFGVHFDPISIPLVSRKGFLNYVFAAHSFEIHAWWFAAMTAYVCIYQAEASGSILPLTTEDLKQRPNWRLLVTQAEKLVLIYGWISALIQWFFGDAIFARILRATGGHCSNGDPALGYHSCLAEEGNSWIGGTKLSGHSLILSCFATSLMYELVSLMRVYRINREGAGRRERIAYRFVLFSVLGTVGVWMFMFGVTCVFYHTMFERVVGLACGLFVPYVVDVRWVKHFS